MADPYDSDSAVEQIISEAMDHHILEQISSINLSGVQSDSLLPTDLETRFRKLKSFPATNPKRHNQSLPCRSNSQIEEIPNAPNASQTIPTPVFSSPEIDFNPKPKTVKVSSSSVFSSSSEDECSAHSSPKQNLCFCFSPNSKRVSKKKTKKKKSKRVEVDDDALSLDSFISDLGKFSLKDQKKSLKRALKEQEKITREAEEVIDLAKQLSARMDDYIIDDDKFK